MGIKGLFDFYREAGGYAAPDPAALERAGESGVRHAAYHQRIVRVSCACGAVGGVLGVVVSAVMAAEAKSGKDAKGVLLTPFLFGGSGLLFGAALACLFAPHEFLAGPVGQKWMKLIGTKSVLAARVVCAVFGLVIVAPFIGLGLLAAFGK